MMIMITRRTIGLVERWKKTITITVNAVEAIDLFRGIQIATIVTITYIKNFSPTLHDVLSFGINISKAVSYF